MNKIIKIERNLGFSLVELMVSMVVGLFLTLGLFTMFRMSSTNVTTTSQFNELQENGRIALAILERDLSQTGFMGDLTGQRLTVGENITVDALDIDDGNDCIGAGLNNRSLPVVSSVPYRMIWGYRSNVSPDSFACLNSVVDNTDVLQVKRLIGPPTLAPNNVNRHYAGTTSNNQIIFFRGNQPAPAGESIRYWELSHHIYYIRNQDGIPSLRRKTLVGDNMAGSDEQLVEGIENLRVLYGVDNQGDPSADVFVGADSVTQDLWDNAPKDFGAPDGPKAKIVALRIFLLVRSLERDPSYTNETTYQLGDINLNAFNDNFRRKVVSTTISLENLSLN
ncbi:pilus assembly protein PilW [Parashewanella spongiae]|uniref:Pilus assembly protein PilW n=1 Tax=Parashewanella spongiae TaxID=342950 RepID=A0A3A6TCT4_9GAMM|nr:PilW family protein [Parashewanella spongiae]MCL1079324.1 PilW family protein [Parashewanella spongiae]RJY10405.1 pilus assembly protein PilW [Parashewanella spongiae]